MLADRRLDKETGRRIAGLLSERGFLAWRRSAVILIYLSSIHFTVVSPSSSSVIPICDRLMLDEYCDNRHRCSISAPPLFLNSLTSIPGPPPALPATVTVAAKPHPVSRRPWRTSNRMSRFERGDLLKVAGAMGAPTQRYVTCVLCTITDMAHSNSHMPTTVRLDNGRTFRSSTSENGHSRHQPHKLSCKAS